jgi:hypothetical protein
MQTVVEFVFAGVVEKLSFQRVLLFTFYKKIRRD